MTDVYLLIDVFQDVFKLYGYTSPSMVTPHKGGCFNRTRDCFSSFTLSNLLVQIFKSNSFQQYISANMSAFLSSCALALWVWSWSGSKALEKISSISSSETAYQTLLPQTSIFKLKREAHAMLHGRVARSSATECASDCVHFQVETFFLRYDRSDGFLVIMVQIWILLTPPSEAWVSTPASCACWNSQPRLSNC